MSDAVDQVARDKAAETRHELRNLSQVTTIQLGNLDAKLESIYAEINAKIERIESAIKWAGGLIVSLILTVLGWAVVQQLNANEAQKKDMQQQIAILQSQERARIEARSEILSRLPPAGAPQPPSAASGIAQP